MEKRPFRGSLTVRRRLGFAATPVSRLFGRRVGRYADSVLMADDDRTRCRAVLLELSRITRLKGRCDAAQPAASVRVAGARRLAHCGMRASYKEEIVPGSRPEMLTSGEGG